MGCGPAGSLYLSTGSGRRPRPPWVAAATTDALPGRRRSHGCSRNARKRAQACRTRADNSTYIERGLAPPTAICHARTPGRRLARARCVCARALSPAPRQRSGGLRGQTERLSAHAGSTQIVGSSQQSGGVRWPPVVAGTQAEVRSGEGKGGGSPARAGRCALRCGRCGGRKEPSPRCVRGLRASWAAAMATLLAARRSRGWRMGAAAAAETGARIGGARAAGSGSSNAAFAATA